MNTWAFFKKTFSKIRNKRILFFVVLIVFGTTPPLLVHFKLVSIYRRLESPVLYDRNGLVIHAAKNKKSNIAIYTHNDIPLDVRKLVLKKEDNLFYLHPGIRPEKMTLVLFQKITGKKTKSPSSTLTQQLVKSLLGNENNRTIIKKFSESLVALLFELTTSKEEILQMYVNTVYLGNNIQGLESGAWYYFDKKLEELDTNEIMILLASLGSPRTTNPYTEKNSAKVLQLAESFGISDEMYHTGPLEKRAFSNKEGFEILPFLDPHPVGNNTTTIDLELTKQIRSILDQHVIDNLEKRERTGAVVVISVPENEILAMVGTPDPSSLATGHQINMALSPRPIGSTIKPFIYGLGFEQGLRPYTLVNDREYRYFLGSGYALYPQNFDGLFRGMVSLREALSNSLNVPALRVLEHVTVEKFGNFMERTIGFKPINQWEDYNLGIALGGLDSDLLTLTELFTIFPQHGVLKPPHLFNDGKNNNKIFIPPQLNGIWKQDYGSSISVFKPQTTEMITHILSDRVTSIDQFGSDSLLNIPLPSYALKTGTSRDYHDSWVVGYTPNYVVGVWIGNSENQPMIGTTGATGAGAVWARVMELVYNSDYGTDDEFTYPHLEQVVTEATNDIGIKAENPKEHIFLLERNTSSLITKPHQNDSLLFIPDMKIPLEAESSFENESIWTVKKGSGTISKIGQQLFFEPNKRGEIILKVQVNNNSEEVKFFVR